MGPQFEEDKESVATRHARHAAQAASWPPTSSSLPPSSPHIRDRIGHYLCHRASPVPHRLRSLIASMAYTSRLAPPPQQFMSMLQFLVALDLVDP